MKILFVDDHENIAECLAVLMNDKGYETKSCTNAFDAMKVIKEWDPDVVYSDVMMPKMSGLELCKQVRLEGYKKPFWFLTAFRQRAEDVKSSGADGLIEKGLDMDKFVEKVRALA